MEIVINIKNAGMVFIIHYFPINVFVLSIWGYVFGPYSLRDSSKEQKQKFAEACLSKNRKDLIHVEANNVSWILSSVNIYIGFPISLLNSPLLTKQLESNYYCIHLCNFFLVRLIMIKC